MIHYIISGLSSLHGPLGPADLGLVSNPGGGGSSIKYQCSCSSGSCCTNLFPSECAAKVDEFGVSKLFASNIPSYKCLQSQAKPPRSSFPDPMAVSMFLGKPYVFLIKPNSRLGLAICIGKIKPNSIMYPLFFFSFSIHASGQCCNNRLRALLYQAFLSIKIFFNTLWLVWICWVSSSCLGSSGTSASLSDVFHYSTSLLQACRGMKEDRLSQDLELGFAETLR